MQIEGEVRRARTDARDSIFTLEAVMLSMSPYSAIYSNINTKSLLMPSQKECYKSGLKIVFNGFRPSQHGCSKSGIQIVFKWSRPFKDNF